MALVIQLEQDCITSNRGGIHGQGTFPGEAEHVMWTSSFRSGSGKPFTAKRLNTDNRADHVPVDVAISGQNAFRNVLLGAVNTAVNTYCKTITGSIDFIDDPVQVPGTVPDYV